jgi:GntR family transcriptional regulator, carbon starvation induced regulator
MAPANNGSPLSSSGVTLAGTLAERLREEITGGRLTPGTKLHLEDLKETFGVSLSPLREALSRLSGEGFVVMQGQRGRNSDKAANLLRKHIERTGSNVLKNLTKSGGA